MCYICCAFEIVESSTLETNQVKVVMERGVPNT